MKLSELNTRLDLLEWLIMHPGAKEAPIFMPEGWFLWTEIREEEVFGWFRHRDGRKCLVSVPIRAKPELALCREAQRVLNSVEKEEAKTPYD